MKIKGGKFDRLPSRYSEELFGVIRWMLHQDPDKRPSCQELLSNTQLKVRVKEKHMQEFYTDVKRKESELQKREQTAKEKEKEIASKLKLI